MKGGEFSSSHKRSKEHLTDILVTTSHAGHSSDVGDKVSKPEHSTSERRDVFDIIYELPNYEWRVHFYLGETKMKSNLDLTEI
jgi:hypothetical protein